VLSGLHFLLTYQCNRECDHCFVWGGPWQKGVMTFGVLRDFLGQAEEAGTVKEIWLEGGEPFLYYQVMLEGARLAVKKGFKVGIVTNGYWATSHEDAVAWLRPLAGTASSILVSCDDIHWSEEFDRFGRNAESAAKELGIGTGFMRIVDRKKGTIPGVMYRGRAAVKLAPRAEIKRWETFDKCPFESLGDPARVHVDPFGNLHVCQGVVMGNLHEKPLKEICAAYSPGAHPVIGPLLAGGPVELVRKHRVPHKDMYVDACHMCYESRRQLRSRFPEILGPSQMYGET